MSDNRNLSAYAFTKYGNDAKLYNGIHDLETKLAQVEQALKEADMGKVSSTFGELAKGCETLSHRIEPHVWDNMPIWEQRDWLITQAEMLHQQWCDKWRKTLDRESDTKAELQQALESERINVINAVNGLTQEIESRAWLATGARGSYEWDDAKYQQEFADAAEAIMKALEPLRRIGTDLSNCPADAKRSLEKMRSEAGRKRAIEELRTFRAMMSAHWTWVMTANKLTERIREIEQEDN